MKKVTGKHFSVKSAAMPTESEAAAFSALSYEEQCAFLDAELDKGLSSNYSDKTVTDILNEVKLRHCKQNPD